MESKRATLGWPAAIVITLCSVGVFDAGAVRAMAMSTPIQPPESQPVTLTLECLDSTTIRFEITNVGSTDTALPLGLGLANGRQYLINGLKLRMKPSNGNGTDYNYWPRRDRAVTGGRFDQWFERFL